MKQTIHKTLFEQYSQNTFEFISFAKTFKKEFKSEISNVGAVLTDFNVGHFYLSGFFTFEGRYFYFSWHNGDKQIMYRTAKHNKDFTGGNNHYVRIDIEDGEMIRKMNLKAILN